MEKSYDWILENRPYFGQPNGIYDFKATDPREAGSRITKLQELKAKLSRTVNTRAMVLLEKEEEQVSLHCFLLIECGVFIISTCTCY